jgi:GNAT superfamily N-acetyltransferase
VTASKTVAIHAADFVDAPQVAELLTELGYPTSATEAAERLARRADSILVADDGTRLLGLLAIWSQLPIARAKPVARITAMVVRSETRGQGVGKRLMEHAVKWARDAGCEGIELTSGLRTEREQAHEFYESLGFQKTSYRFWLSLNASHSVSHTGSKETT